MERKKFHYGWVIVIACFIITMFIQLETNTWSYFQMPICAELGCSYVVFNLTTMLATVANMVFGLVLASKIGRGNLRLYMLIGGVSAGVLWILQSFCSQIWMLFVTYGLLNFMLGMILYIPINILMSFWFIDRKAFALSLGLLGSSIGQMIFSTAIANILAVQGWRYLSRLYGFITIAAAVIVYLLVRKTPQEKGLEPYRSEKGANAATQQAGGSAWIGLDKKEALKTGTFWVFVIAMICIGLLSSGIITQLPTFLTENNISYAPIMALYSLVVIISKLVLGPLFDRIGVIGGTIVCSVFLIVSMILLQFIDRGMAIVYIAVVLYSLGCTIGALTPPLMVSKLFGYKDYGGVYGIANFFFYGGCMAGSIISSGIRTSTGSYSTAWIVMAVVAAVLIVTSVISGKLGDKLRENA